MTNPLKNWQEAVREVIKNGQPTLGVDEMVFLITRRTKELMLEIVGEDEPILPGSHLEYFKDGGNESREKRNLFRESLRQKINELTKEEEV